MFLDCNTKLFVEITEQEILEMLAWAEDVVLRGKVAWPDPKFVEWWLSSNGYDDRQRLLVISTALPQMILLSISKQLMSVDVTAEEFERRFGRIPENDDLDRVNCKVTNTVGHWHCGICPAHDKPRFECGCLRVPLPKG